MRQSVRGTAFGHHEIIDGRDLQNGDEQVDIREHDGVKRKSIMGRAEAKSSAHHCWREERESNRFGVIYPKVPWNGLWKATLDSVVHEHIVWWDRPSGR